MIYLLKISGIVKKLIYLTKKRQTLEKLAITLASSVCPLQLFLTERYIQPHETGRESLQQPEVN